VIACLPVGNVAGSGAGGLLLLPVFFSLVYWGVSCGLLVWWVVRGRQRQRQREAGTPLEPVLLLRPVKRGVPGLEGKVRVLVASARPGDRLLFAVSDGEDLRVCEAACREASPGVSAQAVEVSPPEGGSNPKIAKLMRLMEAAGPDAPERIIVTDSEALLEPGWLDGFRAEWERSGADAITAGYRFVGARRWPQQLDQLPALLTLWPGLIVSLTAARGQGKGLALTLGACTGVRRGDLEAVGGWEALLPYLAEDHRLGEQLAAAGKRVKLADRVLTLDADPMGWADWMRHQHRVAVTYRVCQPAGVLGMVLTHGVSWALLFALYRWTSPGAWLLLLTVIAARVAGASFQARLLGFPLPRRSVRRVGAITAASLAETFFWLAAWLPLPVRWGARSYRLGKGGKLSKLNP